MELDPLMLLGCGWRVAGKIAGLEGNFNEAPISPALPSVCSERVTLGLTNQVQVGCQGGRPRYLQAPAQFLHPMQLDLVLE